ncbi:hypothetical protein [Amaricoccus sp.]|nr:hypothetical protein [Amaricoccus sp.]HMR59767.1 hypothetical protein [Amaricoccus sp.]
MVHRRQMAALKDALAPPLAERHAAPVVTLAPRSGPRSRPGGT